jgi:putative transposase
LQPAAAGAKDGSEGDAAVIHHVCVQACRPEQCLWRAVGQDGNVLDILVQIMAGQGRRPTLFRGLMKKTRSVPRVVVTDKLRSYGAAHREVMPSVEYRSHKRLNNRAENGRPA